MRKAKLILTGLLILSMVLLFAMPFVLARNPGATGDNAAKKEFAIFFTSYSIFLMLVFFATVVAAWIVVRKQREEFRAASMQNLKELIEGTLSDHDRKRDP